VSEQSAIAAAHDRMVQEYDDLDDLYYPWLFARLHEFIAAHLPAAPNPARRAVDAGCGTGFQSFLLVQAGYDVTGLDLAARLVDAAQAKSPLFSVPPLLSPPFFRSSLGDSWIAAHHRRLAKQLDLARSGRNVRLPRFVCADLRDFPLEPGTIDVITCCGSVVSFLDEYAQVIYRMASSLRLGGRLFLEVEQKRNLDLFWPVLDRLSAGALGYGQSWPVVLANLAAPPGRSVRVRYPFELRDGSELTLPIWLFSVREFEELFCRCNLRVVARVGVHHVTNLVPSTVLHKPAPPPALRGVFNLLRCADGALGTRWPFWRLGCSVAFCLEKRA